jgi:hypothetical protein
MRNTAARTVSFGRFATHSGSRAPTVSAKINGYVQRHELFSVTPSNSVGAGNTASAVISINTP